MAQDLFKQLQQWNQESKDFFTEIRRRRSAVMALLQANEKQTGDWITFSDPWMDAFSLSQEGVFMMESYHDDGAKALAYMGEDPNDGDVTVTERNFGSVLLSPDFDAEKIAQACIVAFQQKKEQRKKEREEATRKAEERKKLQEERQKSTEYAEFLRLKKIFEGEDH